MFALHRQCEVSVTVESIAEAIVRRENREEMRVQKHTCTRKLYLHLKGTRALCVFGRRALIGCGLSAIAGFV